MLPSHPPAYPSASLCRLQARHLAFAATLLFAWLGHGQPARAQPMPPQPPAEPARRNVVGTPLVACCTDKKRPIGGWKRDGRCTHFDEDPGAHVVCARVSEEFLAYSRRVGNDLSTPRPEHGFAGLQPGDAWCLCARRWQQALANEVAPPVILEATDGAALAVIELAQLKAHAAPKQAPPPPKPQAKEVNQAKE